MHLFVCFQIPPRENWFQHVRRVYATAINFPCIITLSRSINQQTNQGFQLLRSSAVRFSENPALGKTSLPSIILKVCLKPEQFDKRLF